MSALSRVKWYREANRSLGPVSLLRLQYQKRLGGEFMRLTSRDLRHPVVARRGSSDLHVFHQVFVERQYACVNNVREPGVVLDLGANVGYASAYFLSRFPSCTVLAVEPDPNNFALLQRNLKPYNGRARAIQCAVWWRAQSLRFKRSPAKGEEWGRSLDENGASEEPPVNSMTIDMIFTAAEVSRISILKIDIEGAERKLFSHNTSWLDSVDNIAIELHDEECRRVFSAAVDPLTEHKSASGELTYCKIRRLPPSAIGAAA